MIGSARRGAWLAATALTCATASAAHAQAGDPRDARINALEAQVKALTEAVSRLQAGSATGRAAGAPAAAAAPQVAVGATQGNVPGGNVPGGTALASASPNAGSPPATSPDQPRPVTSGGPGPNQGGATILAGRPSIQSGDGRFVANLHGVMQWDAAYYSQKSAGPIASDFRRSNGGDAAHARDLNSGTNFRRARIGIDGRVFGDFDYNVLFEFGGAGTEDAGHIQELWLQYTGLQPFRFRVGAYPPPVGLEDQNSTNGMPFLERPAISDISRGVAGGDYREAVTLAASRSRWFAAASITTRTVGVANSSAVGAAQTFDQNLGGIVRLAAIPIQGDNYLVHVGVHGTRVFEVADQAGPPNAAEVNATRFGVQLQERPELRVDGTRLIGTGAINARHVNEGGLELAGQYGPFYAQGEYERITIDRRDSPLANPKFHGFYVEGGLMLTGERRKYNTGTFAFDGPPVNHPFDLKNGTIGAVELAARYSLVDLNYRQGLEGHAAPADGVRGGEQKILALGVNWYLNPVIRFMLDYQHVSVDRLSPSAATYLTPAGVQIGQHYNTVEVRSQLAF